MEWSEEGCPYSAQLRIRNSLTQKMTEAPSAFFKIHVPTSILKTAQELTSPIRLLPIYGYPAPVVSLQSIPGFIISILQSLI